MTIDLKTYTIVHTDGRAVLWEGEAESLARAVHQAIAAGGSLRGANFRRADLVGADLRRADLVGAVLTGADLTEADITSAFFT